MGLGRLEPEAPQGPETAEDWPKANRRSTTDLTLLRNGLMVSSHTAPVPGRGAEAYQALAQNRKIRQVE
jgi:hypothetical protein